MRAIGGVIKLNGLIPARHGVWDGGGLRNYMNEQIQHVGPNVSQEIIAKLRSKWGAAGFFKGCSRRNCWRGGKPGTNR